MCVRRLERSQENQYCIVNNIIKVNGFCSSHNCEMVKWAECGAIGTFFSCRWPTGASETPETVGKQGHGSDHWVMFFWPKCWVRLFCLCMANEHEIRADDEFFFFSLLFIIIFARQSGISSFIHPCCFVCFGCRCFLGHCWRNGWQM